MPEQRVLELTEYQRHPLPDGLITRELHERLWRDYRQQVTVEQPGPGNDHTWALTPQGYVGFIPLAPELALQLQPKVPLDNVFGMLEWAYQHQLTMLTEEMRCESLREFYERLAVILAKRVLNRGRKGFYRDYLGQEEDLPYVRGRMDMGQTARRPWAAKPHCIYQEHTADLEENQILAWTLTLVARAGLQREDARHVVRQAHRKLQGACALQPFSGQDCVDRLYNRLNDDYRPLHALCRFFLDHTGPTHRLGDHGMVPFLIEMPHLYEAFVAAWLQARLSPTDWRLTTQEKVTWSDGGELEYNIDLVLYSRSDDCPYAVLDTKYKRPERPSPDDIAQVVAYAETKGCARAFLIYPVPVASVPRDAFQHVTVQALTFGLEGDLETCGQAFLAALGIA